MTDKPKPPKLMCSILLWNQILLLVIGRWAQHRRADREIFRSSIKRQTVTSELPANCPRQYQLCQRPTSEHCITAKPPNPCSTEHQIWRMLIGDGALLLLGAAAVRCHYPRLMRHCSDQYWSHCRRCIQPWYMNWTSHNASRIARKPPSPSRKVMASAVARA